MLAYPNNPPMTGNMDMEMRLADRRRRRESTGILRLDISKPRRSSGSSVEFRNTPEPEKIRLEPQFEGEVEPVSPQPSVLSVTFAVEEPSVCSDSSVKVNIFNPGRAPKMDKVRFNKDHTITGVCVDGEEDEEEYSASVSAIIQRRVSTKRQSNKHRGATARRRPSSPFSPDPDSGHSGSRRRSSVFTTSSGDTAVSIHGEDEVTTEEQIFQNIKLHKEVLSNVRQQPWPMRRKVKLVQQAQAYVKRHEGELQERLAQSKSTKDIVARCNIILVKRWQRLKRELANLMNVLIPWELRIKEIESHFGSVVASYFTFLRWLFWVNFVISVVLIAFVALPEMLMVNHKKTGERKEMLPEEAVRATNLMTLWDFEGILKYSPFFYGFYTNQDSKEKGYGYRMPLVYFLTGLAVYIYSFVATLRKMAENSRQSKLSEKDDECVFTWKLFTGWDYMIGNAETAHNRTASIILGFKEALLEEAEKKRDEGRTWKRTSLRVFANLNVIWLLGSSVYAVILVVDRSTQPEAESSWWRQNEQTLVITTIGFIFPIMFDLLGHLERYHPRKTLRMQLARIMALNLLNLYTFTFSTFSKIHGMTLELQKLKQNATIILPRSPPIEESTVYLGLTGTHTIETSSVPTAYNSTDIQAPNINCFKIPVNCSTTTESTPLSSLAAIATLLLSNATSSPIQTNSTTSYDGVSFSTQDYIPFTPSQLPTFYPALSSLLNISDDMLNSIALLNFSNNTLFTNTPIVYQEYESNKTMEVTDYDYIDNDDYVYYDNGSIHFVATANHTNHSSPNSTSETLVLINILDNILQDMYNFSISDTINNSSISIWTYPNESTPSISNPSATSLITSLMTKLENNTFMPEEELMMLIKKWSDFPLLISNSESPSGDSSDCFIIRCVNSTQESTSFSDEFLFSMNHVSTQTAFDNYSTPGTIEPDAPVADLSLHTYQLDINTRRKLRKLCWETMFGQELVKLTVMDLVVTVGSTMMVDFFRAVFVRVMNNCWCWDLEKQFPQYGDFKIAENILHLVNNQGMVWMGMFFSPGLPLINLLKLAILMYLRSWAVLTCNVPHQIVFRASRSNNFYLTLLLTMLFLCVLPVGYAIVWVRPSWHCGPFSNYKHIYHIFTRSLKEAIPKPLHRSLDYIASPGIVIPLLMLLVLIIYYLISLTNALREANNDLKLQLRRERTEERRKMFRLVDRRHQGEVDTPYAKWKKILPVLPSSKSPLGQVTELQKDDTAISNSVVAEVPVIDKTDIARGKEIISRLLKHRKRKSSATYEDICPITQNEEGHHNGKVGRNKAKKQQAHHKKEQIHPSNGSYHGSHTHENKKSKRKEHSPSTSSTNREREDSLASAWSEIIPEIRISQSDSHDSQEALEDERPTKSSSTDTMIAVDTHKGTRKHPKTHDNSDMNQGTSPKEEKQSTEDRTNSKANDVSKAKSESKKHHNEYEDNSDKNLGKQRGRKGKKKSVSIDSSDEDEEKHYLEHSTTNSKEDRDVAASSMEKQEIKHSQERETKHTEVLKDPTHGEKSPLVSTHDRDLADSNVKKQELKQANKETAQSKKFNTEPKQQINEVPIHIENSFIKSTNDGEITATRMKNKKIKHKQENKETSKSEKIKSAKQAEESNHGANSGFQNRKKGTSNGNDKKDDINQIKKSRPNDRDGKASHKYTCEHISGRQPSRKHADNGRETRDIYTQKEKKILIDTEELESEKGSLHSEESEGEEITVCDASPADQNEGGEKLPLTRSRTTFLPLDEKEEPLPTEPETHGEVSILNETGKTPPACED